MVAIPGSAHSHGRRALAMVVGLALVPLPGGCSAHQFEAIDLLRDIKAGHGPSELKATTLPPRRAEVRYAVAGRPHVGDVWEPGRGAGAPDAKADIVLVPGVAPAGRDDPRLTAFAASLARSRFRVLVPEIPNLRKLHVAATDAGIIADAIHYLVTVATARNAPAPHPVALVAISYAVGPAILAMREDRARPHVRLLLTIGGYRDLGNVIAYFSTGWYRDAAGRLVRGAPDRRAKWAFLEANAERTGSAADAEALTEIATRRRRNPRAPIAALRQRLGPGGRAILALVENTGPDRVPALVDALPPALRQNLRALDLAPLDLSDMSAEALFLHGAADPVIPAAESRALLSAWTPGRARLLLLDGVRHVNAGGLGLSDSLRLMAEAARILELRDAWYRQAVGG